jgi:hypothetical protein
MIPRGRVFHDRRKLFYRIFSEFHYGFHFPISQGFTRGKRDQVTRGSKRNKITTTSEKEK